MTDVPDFKKRLVEFLEMAKRESEQYLCKMSDEEIARHS